MAGTEDLQTWVMDAITANQGSATVIEVAEYIWRNHEDDLRQSGPLFYSWQYDMRWAAQRLRDSGRLAPSPKGSREWRLPPN